MYTVQMEKECGCFKRSDYSATQTFANKEDAQKEALAMCEDMNETFCKKHNFQVEDQGETLLIKVALND